ncbi:MAG: MBOAT family protein [bacterium]|nr:MBOAT family protein [bacterium]
MLFNTSGYLFFFVTVFVVYYGIPKKARYIWLLIASYYFYMNWNPWYIGLLFGCTVVTYLTARLIERYSREEKRRKLLRRCVLIVCVMALLGGLGYFKYFDFFLQYGNKILSVLHCKTISRKFDLVLPVGISFYVLQSLGYVFDVYKGEVYAEKNFLKYALFVSFFPQLVAGPIERTKQLLKQLEMPDRLTWHTFRKGLLLILYGLFCKMVIADRIAVIVETVYHDPQTYPGMYIVYAAFLFSFQIYCDFYGYSTIARGSALMLGVRLTDNFCAPYFSKSIKEFWRRWHISLSSWFRDYLYIPLGGNRKGTVRKEGNLLFVFGVSGLWHGASMAFVFWGFLNGLYQVLGDLFHTGKTRIEGWLAHKLSLFPEEGTKKERNFSSRLFATVMTFVLVTFTWIFFAAGSMSAAMETIKCMLSTFNWQILLQGGIYQMGVGREYTYIMWGSIILLMLVDALKYRGKDVAELILHQGWWFRVLVFVGLIVLNMLFGCYGEIYDTQQFIYFQF